MAGIVRLSSAATVFTPDTAVEGGSPGPYQAAPTSGARGQGDHSEVMSGVDGHRLVTETVGFPSP